MTEQGLLEVKLVCIDEASAQEVLSRAEAVPKERRGRNFARREGRTVVITYDHAMWPYDLADMAAKLELAGDTEASAVFACL